MVALANMEEQRFVSLKNYGFAKNKIQEKNGENIDPVSYGSYSVHVCNYLNNL